MIEATTTGGVRKELYAYLTSLGIDVEGNEEIHKKIKNFIVLHTRLDNEQITKERQQFHDALQNTKNGAGVKGVAKRLLEFRCPTCGLAMLQRSAGEYVTTCGHFSEIAFCLS